MYICPHDVQLYASNLRSRLQLFLSRRDQPYAAFTLPAKAQYTIRLPPPSFFFNPQTCLCLFVSGCAASIWFSSRSRARGSQCCRRKLVAMLMSLLDTRRASRASSREKPISTNLATCRRQNTRGGCNARNIMAAY